MKQLVFDTTDANTIADSDSVGAYLRASDGTLLTHTDVSGKKALDVRLAEGVNVEVDLSHVDDSVKIGDGTDFLAINGDGSINATVSATNLDIRDLVFATDKVDVSGSTLGANSGVDIGDVTINNAAGASAVNIQDGGNSITVDASQLDIDDLNATDDAVQAWLRSGTGTAITSRAEDGGQALDVHITGSAALTVNDAALANTAIASAANALDVADTAENVVTSPLSNRKYLFIYNYGNRQIFVGASGVTSANGYPLDPAAQMILRAGAAVDIEWVGPNTSQVIRTLELS